MYKWIVLKRKLESVLIFPFVLLGQFIGQLSRHENYEVYFFFPFYHIGGAEKIHYQIAQTFINKKCIIFFTRKSRGQNFLKEFEKPGFVIKDISKFTDNKLLYPLNFIYRGLISYKINHQKSCPLVFNGQSNFGYKISPWISTSIPQIDLIHALCSFSKIRIPFLEFYRTSVTVSKEIIEKHKNLYKKYAMPLFIINNIQSINYGIELPKRLYKKGQPESLNILYVGRGSEEKRIYLIAKIAKKFSVIDPTIKFNFLGDVELFIPNDLKKYCTLIGSVTDVDKINQIYRENDVLLVTSYTESGPLVAMEAMARGLSIIATPVGIINEHIVNEKNGFIFSSIENEGVIVKEAIDYILKFKSDPELRSAISKQNIDFAYENFGIEKFQQNYRNLFSIINPSI